MIAAALAAAFLAGMFLGWIALPVVLIFACLAVLLEQRIVLVAGAAFLLCLSGVWRAPDPPSTIGVPAGQSHDVVLQVSSAVIDTGQVQHFQVRLENGTELCVQNFESSRLGRGDRLRGTLSVRPVTELPAGYAASVRARKCAGVGYLSDVVVLHRGTGIMRWVDGVRSAAVTRLEGWVPGDRGALLSGLVIGDDARLADSTADAFIATGTYHVVAISGANLTLLVALLAIFLIWIPQPWTDIAPLLPVWMYVLIGGAGPPTVRAGLLATIVVLGRVRGRSIDLLTLTILIAAVQAAIWPHVTLGLSYQLSTVAMIVVLLVSGGRRHLPAWHPMRVIAVSSLTVNLAILPLLPPASRPALLPAIVANLLIALPVAAAFILGLVALGLALIAPGLGQPFALLAGQTNGLTIGIVRTIAGIDWIPRALLLPVGSMPEWFIALLAVCAVLLASHDLRRTLLDLRWAAVSQAAVLRPIAIGAGIGLLGAISIVIMY
ncbi:MAG TPA: ComEC/Rec2 family competence protein [Thermomicrobiales bacterium]|nr:ComEC/Rec2 family competence protein [Thermomicrobiales bacterium]